MAIFSEKTFYDLLNRLLVIHPSRDECITGVGYDLTIGFYVKVNRRRRRIEASGETQGEGDDIISLDPDTYLIVVSREFVYLSSRVAATFHSKSSLAAQAIFLNSTTGDPNWVGRLIFLLYNASGTVVQLDLDRTFATMVVHFVERRSRKIPTDPKTVLAKYIEGFEGNLAPAIQYVMRDDKITKEFYTRVDWAKRFANRPFPFVVLAILFYRYLFPIRWTLLWLVLTGISMYVALKGPSIFPQGERQLSIIGSIASIISLGVVVFSWLRQRRKQETSRLG